MTFLFLLAAAPAEAKLVTINDMGEIVWSVLSDEASITLEPTSSFIEIKKIDQDKPDQKPVVSLGKQDGKISLKVSSENGTKELEINKNENNLIEIEERPEVNKLIIGVQNDKFRLEQKGVVAYTENQINIDASSAKLKVATSKGDEFLTILPYEAVEAALRTKLLTSVSRGKLEISEHEGELQYKMDGNKTFNLFDLYAYSIPVTAYVSPLSGELLSIDSPGWYKYVSFLFI
ncbi:MAG: hypothetical protein US60_C0054G0007 [Microgenomates group bacterium GW2011_GWC1_37_8]|uniref:Uncharacterized protein n=1 Tax=Candidatus Woesebacteria bacterium GW2011_GWB1_38_8 TaxID=1618570 RepID=A0A0G0P8P5_9BACT|nr:MAG: hypothetical protein US60_C0054G0007 [Microgenomates group bacterium GW2011_GWC1_37_8]KKQ85676.1 MAG: hypothetical protein UT08_C0005G0127 [Candidatus Woesebacteria bacterium GW2011_GWB1_38_8]